MSFSGSHQRQSSAMPGDKSYNNPGYHQNSLYSTAYNGSEGHIEDGSVRSVDLGRDGYDDVPFPAPTKAATPARPALGSRLLSSFASAQPTASALTRKGSLLHARAKSLAGFGPKINTNIESAPSPLKQQQTNRNSVFGDIFSGESAPIRLGPPVSPTKEKEESEFVMEYKPAFTERPGGGPRRRSTAQTQVSTATTTPAKGGWFTRKPSTLPNPAPRKQDDILAIDLNSALFPDGPADQLSPHAFNDLLLNATALLQRMQTAYKEKVDYIASIQPEIDAQKEEVEEAETRSRHLKIQLEDMSHKANEQNKAMQEMAMQLAEEKIKVHEAREAAAHSSVKLVRQSTDKSTIDGEDEETPRRRKRASGGSASDSGFESDLEYAESVMSGGAETPLSPPAMTLTPAYDGQDWAFSASKSRGSERPGLSRGSTRSGSSSTAFTGKRLGSEGAAWATVESLRGENKDLRRQMDEMQRTLQGCIDFVGTVKA